MEENKELKNEEVASQATESTTNNDNSNGANASSAKKNTRYQRNYKSKNDMQNTFKKRVCKFCAFDATMPTYKSPEALKRYISERGKILPQRVTGACAKHQRMIAREIKRARILAYLPFDRK